MEWKLFADLAEIAGSKRVTVEVEPNATVGDAFAALLADRSTLEDRVLDEDGALSQDVNVLRNGTNVMNESGMDTELDVDDELALFPPVSGG